MDRVVGWALLAGLPGVGLALLLPWLVSEPRWQPSSALLTAMAVVVVGGWAGAVWRLRERLVRPLQTLANVLSGLREGDYSFRARGAAPDDPLGALMLEVNELAETMRQQRLGALEATALLRTVMAEIDVAVFAFDAGERLRLVNRAGARLLARPPERLLGFTAAELGLADCLAGDTPRTVQRGFAGGSGRWSLQRRQFWQGGLPHQLLVIADLSRELREEERLAWQRLVRVLGHELNNSLAPVKSLAGSLESLARREPLPADWREDMRDGLRVIANRAESLNRFVGAYAQLARLPKPTAVPVELAAVVERAVSLETRLAIELRPGPPLSLAADADQLEQLLINLVRNAADAVLEGALPATPDAPRGVRVSWAKAAGCAEVQVEDDGPGVANPANLFVPFFTTKPKGSGIGLVLSRQIAEAHGGSLTLENRRPAPGCVARLRLPL